MDTSAPSCFVVCFFACAVCSRGREARRGSTLKNERLSARKTKNASGSVEEKTHNPKSRQSRAWRRLGARHPARGGDDGAAAVMWRWRRRPGWARLNETRRGRERGVLFSLNRAHTHMTHTLQETTGDNSGRCDFCGGGVSTEGSTFFCFSLARPPATLSVSSVCEAPPPPRAPHTPTPPTHPGGPPVAHRGAPQAQTRSRCAKAGGRPAQARARPCAATPRLARRPARPPRRRGGPGADVPDGAQTDRPGCGVGVHGGERRGGKAAIAARWRPFGGRGGTCAARSKRTGTLPRCRWG